MRTLMLAGALTLATCALAGAQEVLFENTSYVEQAAPCQLPVTKVYRIQPGFCPQALVCLIPKAVGPSCCGCECGPYGIPPIYASGQNVLVRQTPEVQERVAEFLNDLGALVPRKR